MSKAEHPKLSQQIPIRFQHFLITLLEVCWRFSGRSRRRAKSRTHSFPIEFGFACSCPVRAYSETAKAGRINRGVSKAMVIPEDLLLLLSLRVLCLHIGRPISRYRKSFNGGEKNCGVTGNTPPLLRQHACGTIPTVSRIFR